MGMTDDIDISEDGGVKRQAYKRNVQRLICTSADGAEGGTREFVVGRRQHLELCLSITVRLGFELFHSRLQVHGYDAVNDSYIAKNV
mmetsp:Transcript_18271/g.27143  ORF Transcript_18271/g.27143 Transcript_18271/m.27143 type:complete len:87 (+) Transcript_18271:355-615(+)